METSVTSVVLLIDQTLDLIVDGRVGVGQKDLKTLLVTLPGSTVTLHLENQMQDSFLRGVHDAKVSIVVTEYLQHFVVTVEGGL